MVECSRRYAISGSYIIKASLRLSDGPITHFISTISFKNTLKRDGTAEKGHVQFASFN